MKPNRKKELQHKKQELQDDAFLQTMTKAWDNAAAARHYIFAGAAAIIVVVLVFGLLSLRADRANREGWSQLALFEARLQAMPSETESDQERLEAARLKGLAELSESVSGGARPVVMIQYAEALFKEGGEENFRKTAEVAEEFVKKFSNNYWVLMMQQLHGKALFELEDYETALKSFQAVQDAFDSKDPVLTGLRHEANFFAGRSNELLGRHDEARVAYELLVSRKDESPVWAELAQYRLSKLQS